MNHPSLKKIHGHWLLVVTAFLICTAYVQPAHAATKYWVGTGTGAVNVARNWSIYSASGSTTTAPGPGDSMVFNAGSTVGAHITSSMTGGSIVIQSGYTGNISLSGSVALTLSTLTIGRSSSKVVMGANSRLILQASGTPLTGSGTLDTTTNTPNTVEYTGPATTNITAAAPATAYNNLTLDPKSFSRSAALTLNSGDNTVVGSAIDTTNGFLYLVAATSPGIVVKIRLSDFTRVGALTLGASENTINPFAIDTTNGFLYVMSETSPSIISKIRLSDFTDVATLTLNSGENNPGAAIIDSTNGYLYAVVGSSTNTIVKVRLSDFTRVGSLTLNSGETNSNSLAIDTTNGFLYVPTNTSPAKVVKVRLSDFTRVGALTFNSGENNADGALIDTANGFLYLPTNTSPAKIIKVRLSDFTELATLTFNSGENTANAYAIDTTNGFLYVTLFTFGSTPTPFAKVRLSDFTRVGMVTLKGATENDIYAVSIDLHFPTFVYLLQIYAPNFGAEASVPVNEQRSPRRFAVQMSHFDQWLRRGLVATSTQPK